jgi:hypothetical protein
MPEDQADHGRLLDERDHARVAAELLSSLEEPDDEVNPCLGVLSP